MPVITTRTGGSEVVRGGVGVIVEPGDVNSLAKALDRLMGDDTFREELSHRAWRRAQSLTYEAICRQIIGGVVRALT